MIKDDFITIIIPFLNEEENLPVLFSRCNNVSKKINIEFEYIFIDDGSSDNSLNIIKNLASTNDNIKFIQLKFWPSKSNSRIKLLLWGCCSYY